MRMRMCEYSIVYKALGGQFCATLSKIRLDYIACPRHIDWEIQHRKRPFSIWWFEFVVLLLSKPQLLSSTTAACSVNTLRMNSPSSPGLKVDGMMT